MGAISGSGLSLGTLSIVIEAAVDQALAAFQKFGTDVGKVIDDQAQKWEGLKTAGDKLMSVGTGLSVAITAPVVAAAAASVSAASGFEQAMNKIIAVSDATGADLESLRQVAMKLGADTKYSAKEAADGMGELAAQGLTTAQVISAMPGVLDLAAAGELSVKRAAEVTTDTLGQFALSASQAGHVADIFAAGAAASAINAEQLAESMKLVGPVAHLAGMSLEQTTTALALLGNSGLKATEAGTGLRGVLAQLESPSKDAAKALDALGVSVKDSAGNLLPLDQIMKQLQDSGAGATQVFDIFGRESSAAAAILMQQAGPAWAAMTAEIDKADGAAKKMADTLNTGIAGSLDQFKGSIETAAIALGTALEPVILSLLDIGTKLVNDFLLPAIDWFGNLPAPVQAFVGALVALAAALGPVLIAAGALATSIGALMPVITAMAGFIGISVTALAGWAVAIAAVIAALVALGVWVNQNWNGIMAVIQQAISDVTAKIAGFVEWLGKLVPATSAVGQALHSAAAELNKYSAEAKNASEINAKLQKNSDDTAAAHKKAAEEAKKNKDAHKTLGDQLVKTAGATGAVSAGMLDTSETNKAAEKAAKACAAEFKKLDDTNQLLSITAGKLAAAHKKLGEEIVTAKLSGHDITKEFGDGLAPAIDRVDAATGLLIGHFDTLTGNNGLPKVLEKLGQVKLVMDPAVGSIASMNQGLNDLGITSAAKFQQLADDAKKAYDKIIAAPDATQWEKDSAFLKLMEAQKKAVIAAGDEWPAATDKTMADIKAKIEGKSPEVQSAFGGMISSVSTAISNFAQDITKSLWEGNLSWGEKGKALLKTLGEAVTNSFVEPATKAIGEFISGAIKSLLSGDGLGGVVDSIKGIGESLSGIFKGGGGAADAAGGAAGAGGGAGGAASGALGGALGWANLGVSIVSGVVSFFQGSETNKTLDTIGKHTLQTANDLANLRRDDWDRHAEYALWKDDILTALWQIQGNTGTAIASLQAIELHCYNASATLADMLSDQRSGPVAGFMDTVVNALTKMSVKLDTLAAGSMNMNLYGTDPTQVATRIGTSLRLQGGVA